MTQKIMLKPFVDIATYIEGFEIVSSKLGGNGCIYILLIDKIPEREKGMFVQTSLSQFRTYKMLIINELQILDVVLTGEKFNYHYLQPLGEDRLLLVGARARKYQNQAGNRDCDYNAKVCDFDGNIITQFCLGDGIQDVQVTAEGTIWTSYFDEGVYGNYGWDEPIGASGLIAWDEKGNKKFENQVACIDDCYALNVVNEDEVWFYYYTDFKLGYIQGGTDQPEITFMDPHISGSSGFCTDGDHFIFDAGYGKHGTYILKKLAKPGNLVDRQRIQFVDESGEKLFLSSLRKNQLLLNQGNRLYLVEIEQILE
jgi:hypothetical protein